MGTARQKIDFRSYEVLSFDCYGTLIDWERGITDAVLPVLRSQDVSIDPETLLNRYAAYESRIEAGGYLPYKDILRAVMDQFANEYAFNLTDAQRNAIVDSIGNWPAFGDTVDALQRLKKRFKLAIISNVDADLFAQTAQHLRVAFDWIVTASQVGAYKPSKKMFEAALSTFGIKKERWLHVAQSLFHDIAPAGEMGITTVWINRRKNRPGAGATPTSSATPEVEFAGLKELADATERQNKERPR